MAYVDGFVVPVPEGRLDDYRKMAEMACKVWLEHGALQYVEAVGDDVPHGKQTDFYRSVDHKEGELVIFSYVVYESREQRDAVMAKVMADPRLKPPEDLPFDGKRMIWGGFKVLIDESA